MVQCVYGSGSPVVRKGGVLMVTYSDLFTFTLVLVAIITLVIKLHHKK